MKIELDSLPNNETCCLSTILPCFYQFQYPIPPLATLYFIQMWGGIPFRTNKVCIKLNFYIP